MPLLTALEDFARRSLSALPNVWEKLRFVGDLRDAAGEYRHCGLEETFGEQEARAAMASAHSLLFEELASTRLQELWRTAQASAHGTQFVTMLQSITPRKGKVRDLHGVPPEHVHLVTANLVRVAQSRDRSSRAAA